MAPFPEFPAPSPRVTDRTKAVGVLSVTGSDRTRFLTRILSGDLPRAPGSARTALLDPRGRVIAAAVATLTREAVFLECERTREAALLAALERYRIADAVEISPMNRGEIRLWRRDGSDPRGSDPGETAPGAVLDLPGGYLRRDFRPWPAWTIFQAEDLPLPSALSASEEGAAAAAPEEQEYLRILAGEPRWGAELDETSLPLGAGLAAHVRLGKGCYIGQEYVARQAHRGRVPRLLRRLEFAEETLPDPGAKVASEGRAVGRITSTAPPPAGWPPGTKPLALAVLAAEVEPGALVEAVVENAVAHGGRPAAAARVRELPTI